MPNDDKCRGYDSHCIAQIRITELEKRMQIMNDLAKEAVEKASTDLQKRLDGMNEFRQTLRDQANTFITIKEADIRFKNVERTVKDLELSRANLEGKASQQSVLYAYLMAGIGLILAIINMITK